MLTWQFDKFNGKINVLLTFGKNVGKYVVKNQNLYKLFCEKVLHSL